MSGPNAPEDNRVRTAAGPIAMITAVANQIAGETGLACTSDIQNLVIISYLGLLDSPPPEPVSQDRLLENSRHSLIIWAWEQGIEDESLPIAPAPSIAERQ